MEPTGNDELDELREAAGYEPGELPERSNVSEKKATRFYDRIRGSIQRYVEKKGSAAEKTAGFLLFVPDVFILLWRLANDSRVSAKNKVILGSGIAYYIFPIDIVPEAIFGPIGFLDDLVFGVYILNRMLTDTDESILREHWSGSGDLLAMIQRVLASADGLVTSDFLKQIKKMIG
jgi:uncharacterized membrane protein YkvA (DUF1232 family)